MHLASKYGQTEIIESLINSRADVHAKDKWDKTPKDYAKESNYLKMIDVFDKAGKEIGTCQSVFAN